MITCFEGQCGSMYESLSTRAVSNPLPAAGSWMQDEMHSQGVPELGPVHSTTSFHPRSPSSPFSDQISLRQRTFRRLLSQSFTVSSAYLNGCQRAASKSPYPRSAAHLIVPLSTLKSVFATYSLKLGF